ncbi:MAG: DUF4293 family protein [Flavobacteriales bacterium]|jgi:hypothetical protein|uniref:DUF4293 family protein n=1 Tax=Blattabacterium sp. (Mastotermes darwiniensis) TaxID=39768 RepID=UPI000231DDF6|nr:DUF4293 family protein [Blattabacterium sp. (Mastotermes darwiniensis)]AER40554.1 hypothetical protein MADAR_240 [Blattabacterium sp. (Mastotermes darwiniensis) str. MADAR]MDR1805051.1 DUF4293 family protein [Flavobacteriales bacterium]
MFYRIQTFYLFLSVLISSISLYYYPNTQIHPFFLDKIFFTFIIICLILSILSILLFKKKSIQIFCNYLNIIINSTTFLSIIFISCYQNKLLRKTNLFLLLSMILFLSLSNKAIKKDLELIHSINRIR